MIKEAIGFGATVDEAKENAANELGAAENYEVQFEVVATPKKKTLGIFGGRKAEVRAFIELPDESPKKNKKGTAKRANQEKNASKAEKKPAADKAKAENKPTPEKKSVSRDEGYSAPVDASELSPDSAAYRAVEYLKSILKELGCTDLTIKAAEKENAARIDLDGEGVGVLIGRRGETLDSLQYLTSLAANNGGGYYKVSLNVGNYREKREETLTDLAKRVSAQVLETGRNRSLEPMNPYERRIIHTAVQDIEGVVSASFGEGASRRVVIGVEGSDLKPPRRDSFHKDGNYRRDSRSRSSRPKQTVADTPQREPKKDSDTPLYGKIN